MTDFVECSQSGRVLTISFDREPQLNALTHDMYTAVADGLDLAQTDETIRAVVITGKGEAFTTGNDLGEFAKPMPAGKPPVVRFLETLRDVEIPVLAAVNGAAVGVGLTMLLHCDLAFASETATFSGPFTRVGLVPEAGSSLLLPQAVGMAMANDILLAGRKLGADQALSAGLISRVFKPEELRDGTASVAQDMADLAPNAMKKSKLLIRSSRDLVIKQMADESRHFANQLLSPEFTESVTAFLEKRSPQFS